MSYNYGWKWPWSAGLYSRYSAAEEQTMPESCCASVLNNFDPDGPYSNGEWLEFPQGWLKPNGEFDTKGNVMSKPLEGVDSHGRGEVFVFGEFDFVSSYNHAERTPSEKRICVMDAKTTFYPSEDKQKKWMKANEEDEFCHERFDVEYSSKYLPQLSSYAFAFENPAPDEQVMAYYEQEENVWPIGASLPRNHKMPHLGAPLHFEKVHDAGILMFKAKQEIIQTDKDKPEWAFTAESKWVDLEEVIAGRNWEEIITPLAQSLCDIIAEDAMPERGEGCGDCRDGDIYQLVLEHGDKDYQRRHKDLVAQVKNPKTTKLAGIEFQDFSKHSAEEVEAFTRQLKASVKKPENYKILWPELEAEAKRFKNS